jgi:hypothetical protein
VTDFVGVVTEAQNIQLSHQDILKDRLAAVSAALIEVQPDKDQALFVEFNIRPFSLPDDWVFEPCSNHYDTVGPTYSSHVHCVKEHVNCREIFALIQPQRCSYKINSRARELNQEN